MQLASLYITLYPRVYGLQGAVITAAHDDHGRDEKLTGCVMSRLAWGAHRPHTPGST